MSENFDQELAAIVAGDSRAFGRWVAGCEFVLRADLRRFAAFVDVEAVMQETLLRTWQIAPRLTPDAEPNSLLRVSRRIARNLAIDLSRRGRFETPEEAPPEPVFEPRSAPDPFLREAILTCEKKLPKKLAAALDARLRSSGAEADSVLAARLRLKLNTFLQNVTRARRLIEQCLRRRGIDLDLEAS